MQRPPETFLAWLLHALAPRGGSGALPDVMRAAFCGEMDVETTGRRGVKSAAQPFWFLPLDLPEIPLFVDARERERTLVEQVPLERLLRKYDGRTRQHVVKSNARRTYRITRLPPYLMLVMRRMARSEFGVEKNPCVVHLPADGVDLRSVCGEEVGRKYRLVAAVWHEGDVASGVYGASVRHSAVGAWFDLGAEVKQTVEQAVGLRDTCVLLYAPAENVLEAGGGAVNGTKDMETKSSETKENETHRN